MSKFLITKSDIDTIISVAKDEMFKLKLPLHISDKEVRQSEFVTIAVLEAVLRYLNSKKLLTTLVSIDYTDVIVQHDSECISNEEESKI